MAGGAEPGATRPASAPSRRPLWVRLLGGPRVHHAGRCALCSGRGGGGHCAGPHASLAPPSPGPWEAVGGWCSARSPTPWPMSPPRTPRRPPCSQHRHHPTPRLTSAWPRGRAGQGPPTPSSWPLPRPGAHRAVQHTDVPVVLPQPPVHVPAHAVQAAQARGPAGGPAVRGHLRGQGWLSPRGRLGRRQAAAAGQWGPGAGPPHARASGKQRPSPRGSQATPPDLCRPRLPAAALALTRLWNLEGR